MAVVLTYAAQVPVVKLGRLAGQYAKPRSNDTETRGGVVLPAYRGDAVNGLDFTEQSRRHDPNRLMEVYNHSAATLNLIRAFVTGGFADLRAVHSWNQDFVRNSGVEVRYESMADEIERALAFMVACGVDKEAFRTVDFYSSHEALVLLYEHAMTRIDSRTDTPYNTSAHMVWIGERTRQVDGAHVQFARHLRNPIGVKIGPSMTGDEVVALADALDPQHEPGRLTLDFTHGCGQGAHRAAAAGVLSRRPDDRWRVCDPMHGNSLRDAPTATRPARSARLSTR